MSPDPNTPFTADEKFIISLNKVSTMAYLLAVVLVALSLNHEVALVLAIASLGTTALSEVFYLAMKQGSPELMRTQMAISLASWALGVFAGIALVWGIWL